MITIKIKVNQYYPKENSNWGVVYAKPLNNDKYKVDVDPKYNNIKISGTWENDIVQEGREFYVTINDTKNSYGQYQLIFPGKPFQETSFKTLRDFTTTKPVTGQFQYADTLDYADSKIVWDCVSKGSNVNDIKLNSLISYLKIEYNKAKALFDFYIGLDEIGIKSFYTKLKIANNLHVSQLQKAMESIKTNPYHLLNLGLKLKTVDEIALAIGIKANDYNRIHAFSECSLKSFGAIGKTYVSIKELTTALLNGDESLHISCINVSDYTFLEKDLKKSIIKIGKNKDIWINKDTTIVASKYYSDLEKELCEIIKKINHGKNLALINKSDINKAITRCEKEANIKYTSEQKKAVMNSLETPLGIICGAAGTGKSTIAKVISNVYKSKNIIATALAGKAALRLQETTNIEGRTMHSVIGMGISEEELKTLDNTDEKDKIDADLIIIDESSMIGLELIVRFFRKIKEGTRILMLGDNAQLTAIGAGNIFDDMLNSNYINKTILEKVHRQALESNIIKFATNIRLQSFDNDFKPCEEIYDDFELILKDASDKELAEIIISKYKELIKIYKLQDILVVTPQRLKSKISNYEISNKIQELLINEGLIKNKKSMKLVFPDSKIKNKEFLIHVGDRVLNVQNNYSCKVPNSTEKLAVMNGSLGTVLKLIKTKTENGKTKESVLIDFDGIGKVIFERDDLQNIQLGYCISTHKSQGSQAKGVIYALGDETSPRMATNEQIYTGVTRAKDKCIVIATSKILNIAVNTKALKEKQTLLTGFLDEIEKFPEVAVTIDEDKIIELPLEKSEKFPKTAKKPIKKGKKEKGKFPKTDIDIKKRELYDKNNERRKQLRRNENNLTDKAQEKQDKINKIKELYSEGMSRKDICNALNINKSTVSKYLKL